MICHVGVLARPDLETQFSGINMSEYILDQMTWATVKETRFETAVLPWGATEAHNLHLPYGTDTFQAVAVGLESCRRASERGARVVLLPAIPFGVHTQQEDIRLTINMNPSTQELVLRDLIDSLENAGVRKLVILNGHGGNSFRQMIREIQTSTSVFLCEANWYMLGNKEEIFEHQGDHAGEMETSVMMHIKPDLVLPLEKAGSGAERTFKIKALRERRVWAPRKWSEVTDDTGVGDPSSSSADKGVRYLEQVLEELSKFLIDLDASDPTNLYT